MADSGDRTLVRVVADHLIKGGSTQKPINKSLPRPDPATAPSVVFEIGYNSGRVVVARYSGFIHKQYESSQTNYQVEIYDAKDNLLDFAYGENWIGDLFLCLWDAHIAQTSRARLAIEREVFGGAQIE